MARRKKVFDRSSTIDQEQSANDSSQVEGWKRRHANVFDAVAGRISTNGFIIESIYGRNIATLTPEEVLFKSRSAPERTQEDDFYRADRNLNSGSLPDSDLLKVIHSFSSDYYHCTTIDQGQSDAKSLDASALLAIGILLEESAVNILGTDGDLAFVEGLTVEAAPAEMTRSDSERKPSRVASVGSGRSSRSNKRQKR